MREHFEKSVEHHDLRVLGPGLAGQMAAALAKDRAENERTPRRTPPERI